MRELVEHQQHAPTGAVLPGRDLCQALQDLVEHQAQQRLQPRNLFRRNDEVERDGTRSGDDVLDREVRDLGCARKNRIAVEDEVAQRSRDDPGALSLRHVEKLPGARSNDRVGQAVLYGPAKHFLEQVRDRPLRVGEQFRDARERLLPFRIERPQHDGDEQLESAELPVASLAQGAFGIDQHVGEDLGVANFSIAAPDLRQRIVAVGASLGRSEAKDGSE